jgi:hypothetical protein
VQGLRPQRVLGELATLAVAGVQDVVGRDLRQQPRRVQVLCVHPQRGAGVEVHHPPHLPPGDHRHGRHGVDPGDEGGGGEARPATVLLQVRDQHRRRSGDGVVAGSLTEVGLGPFSHREVLGGGLGEAQLALLQQGHPRPVDGQHRGQALTQVAQHQVHVEVGEQVLGEVGQHLGQLPPVCRRDHPIGLPAPTSSSAVGKALLRCFDAATRRQLIRNPRAVTHHSSFAPGPAPRVQSWPGRRRYGRVPSMMSTIHDRQ